MAKKQVRGGESFPGRQYCLEDLFHFECTSQRLITTSRFDEIYNDFVDDLNRNSGEKLLVILIKMLSITPYLIIFGPLPCRRYFSHFICTGI